MDYSTMTYNEMLKHVGQFKETSKKLTDLDKVKMNGLALKDIDNPTNELCLEAVKQNGLSLQYVDNKTNKICIEAIKQTGEALTYLDEQTEELCIIAINNNIKYLNINRIM